MKDIIINPRRQKVELWYLLGAFVVANLFNLWAIFRYDASIKEMYTSFFYVLVFTFFIYVLSVIVRLLIYGVCRLFNRRKTIRQTN